MTKLLLSAVTTGLGALGLIAGIQTQDTAIFIAGAYLFCVGVYNSPFFTVNR